MQGFINGKPVEFQEDETILSVARRYDQFIPTLCELADVDHTPGTCRVCLVEIRREGHAPDTWSPAATRPWKRAWKC